MKKNPLVGIIMGSDSDFPVMKEAIEVLEEFKVPFEVNIVSAHRTPKRMKEYAETAINKGLKVIIAGAGGSAHLPGMTASFTTIPVIGVPIHSKALKGIDSLLSIVQMPAGVPVATVAIDGAKNAALLAVQIISLFDKKLQRKIIDYKIRLEKEVLEKVKNLKS